jgi:hypothetical protein
MPGSNADRYLKLLSMRDAEQAYKEIKSLASSLSDEEHLIRSCIFDLHSAVEIELRGIFFHYFKRLLFLTDDRQQNAVTRSKFEKMIERLGFMDMYRIQEPVLLSWPYPDFNSIIEINKTRNKAAHSAGIEKVTYKDRNPFRDPDCLTKCILMSGLLNRKLQSSSGRRLSAPICKSGLITKNTVISGFLERSGRPLSGGSTT